MLRGIEKVLLSVTTGLAIASPVQLEASPAIEENPHLLRKLFRNPQLVSIAPLDSFEHSVADRSSSLEQGADLNGNRESCPSLPDAATTDSLILQRVVAGQTIEIEISGNTVFSQEEILGVLADEEMLQSLQQQRQPEQLQELEQKLAKEISLLYFEAGYLTSKAVVSPNSNIANGLIKIQVMEGRLSEIQVEGRERLKLSYICDRVLLGVGVPFNANQLGDGLDLLKNNPLLTEVVADLEATGQAGQSRLVISIVEANPLKTRFSIDNYSPPSVGSERLGVGASYGNLTGRGDELGAFYYHSTTSGVDALDFSYRLPLNPMQGTLVFRAAPNWNRITQPPFDALNIRGQRQFYQLNYRQPLVRTFREELALSAGFSFQDGQTFVFDLPTPFGIGPDANGVSRTSVFQLGQEYIRRDSGGTWVLSSQLNFGVGLFGATTNPGSIPDGYFFSWSAQLQRVQRLSDDRLLVVQTGLQLTPDSLLPAHQFVMGGGRSVRGYRQNVRSGDNGFRFSIEDRITAWRDRTGDPLVQVIPFFDLGWVWNASGNPNQLPGQTFLAGAGLGVLWEPFLGIENLSLRLDYGVPLINLRDRGTNAQDEGFYFEFIYQP